MSTNNFKFENILITAPDFNIYHNCMVEECGEDCELKDDTGEFDNFAFDEYVEDVREKLRAIGFEDVEKHDNDRSYGGRIIAEWGQEDNCFIKYLQVIIRDGYYSGINIDWSVDGDFCPEEQSKKEVRHAVMLQKKFDKQVKRLEKVLRTCGTELLKVGQFSNGEAVYKLKK